jgi:hypothetical protein
MEMISIIRIERSSGSHDTDRGSICNWPDKPDK